MNRELRSSLAIGVAVFIAQALIVGTAGNNLTLETRDGVVVERATQRAWRIDLAGDIVNLLGCHHVGAVLLGKSPRFLRYHVCDDQLSTRGMQACAELAGDVATSLHSNT